MKNVLSKIFFAIIGFYLISFFMGYIPLKLTSKEKQKAYCEKLMTDAPLWVLLTIANGDANACLDIGVMPERAKK